MAKFKFKYGVMNSGKSQELIRVWYNYTTQGRKVLVIAPAVDDRYGVGLVTTRAGESIPAIALSDKFYSEIKGLDISEIECVLIDEVQFLPKEAIEYIKHHFTLSNGIPVLAYGLLKDFQNNLFEGSQACLILAEEIEEIETICYYCTKKATMNKRVDQDGNKIADGAQILVGGNESYVQCCHEHWEE